MILFAHHVLSKAGRIEANNKMCKALSHVLLIYREPMIPSVRLCADIIFCRFQEKRILEYKTIGIHHFTKDDLSWADIIIIGRLDNNAELWLAKKLKGKHKLILYVLDDDLLSIPRNSSSFEYYSNGIIRKPLKKIISLADGLISPSPLLLEKYAKGKPYNILIEEPATNFNPPTYPDKRIKIVFAGSIDRTKDVEETIGAALSSIKRKYKNKIDFYFFGAIPDFAKSIDAKVIEYEHDYAKYRERLKSLNLDIGLAPMPTSSFHACKHYNKYIEYSSLGIAGIYSNVPPYTRLTEMNAPAILIGNESEDWEKAISQLIDNKNVLFEYKKACFEFAEKNFNVIEIADKVLPQVIKIKQPQSRRIYGNPVISFRIKLFFSKVTKAFYEYGFKAPYKILKKKISSSRF